MKTPMRTMLIGAAGLTLLMGAPALAQDHAAHHPDAASPATESAAGMPSHEQCQAVMGRMMDPKAVHEHSRDKTGVATWPQGKPLTKAQMDAMHRKCAAMMADRPMPPAKPATPDAQPPSH